MASSIAVSTTCLSIDLSRATASAICNCSKLFAEIAQAILLLLIFGPFAGLQIFVDELVGENEFRVEQAAKRKLDVVIAKAGVADHDIGAIQAQKDGAEALALAARRGDHRRQFDLGFVARPACEVLRAS